MATKNKAKLRFKRGDTFKLDMRVRDKNNTTAEEVLEALNIAQTNLDAAIAADTGVAEAQTAFDAAETSYESAITVDITGWTITAQLRIGDKLTGEFTVVISDESGGFFRLEAEPSLTQTWRCREHQCDIQFDRPGSGVVSSETFIVEVMKDVTRAE